MANTYLLVICAVLSLSQALVNHKVVRSINYDGPNTKSVSNIDIYNDQSIDVVKYSFYLNSTQAEGLIYIEITQEGEPLKWEKVSENSQDGHDEYQVTLETPLQEGEKTKIIIREDYAHLKIPFPKTMKLHDVPMVRVFNNAYYYSRYFTKSMKSSIDFPYGSTIKSHTKVDKAQIKSKSLKVGTFKAVQPFSIEKIYIHSTFDRSLPIFKEVVRTLTVSHSGDNIIDEQYHLVN